MVFSPVFRPEFTSGLLTFQGSKAIERQVLRNKMSVSDIISATFVKMTTHQREDTPWTAHMMIVTEKFGWTVRWSTGVMPMSIS
jgi:hypothetical protein